MGVQQDKRKGRSPLKELEDTHYISTGPLVRNLKGNSGAETQSTHLPQIVYPEKLTQILGDITSKEIIELKSSRKSRQLSQTPLHFLRKMPTETFDA